MEITAFSSDFLIPESRLEDSSRVRKRTPNFITYYMKNCFPASIIAAPLAYGKAELVKTTITFKYDYFTIDRGARTKDEETSLQQKARKLISPFMLAI